MILQKRPMPEQYKLNVEYLLAGYANYIADEPREYEAMTFEQIVNYVNAQVKVIMDYYEEYKNSLVSYYNHYLDKEEKRYNKEFEELNTILEG